MEVKGTAVIAIRDYVKKNYTSDYSKWINSLSPASKQIFSEAIDSTKWYPVESGAKNPTEQLSQLFFGGNLEKGALESGRYSADKALSGIYKIYVMAANPTHIIKRASRVFATYYRPCEMQVVRQNDKGVVSEVSHLTNKYETIINRIVGWCKRALEISGCQDVTIRASHVRDDENGKVIELDMKWS